MPHFRTLEQGAPSANRGGYDPGVDNQTDTAAPRGSEDAVAALERRLARVEMALEQVGLRACRQCGRYFRHSTPRALFELRGAVCVDCIPEWLAQLGGDVTVPERRTIERKLMQWLVAHHQGTIVRESRKLPESDLLKLKVVVGCERCDGSGTVSNSRCKYCDGRETLWVVLLKDAMGPE